MDIETQELQPTENTAPAPTSDTEMKTNQTVVCDKSKPEQPEPKQDTNNSQNSPQDTANTKLPKKSSKLPRVALLGQKAAPKKRPLEEVKPSLAEEPKAKKGKKWDGVTSRFMAATDKKIQQQREMVTQRKKELEATTSKEKGRQLRTATTTTTTIPVKAGGGGASKPGPAKSWKSVQSKVNSNNRPTNQRKERNLISIKGQKTDKVTKTKVHVEMDREGAETTMTALLQESNVQRACTNEESIGTSATCVAAAVVSMQVDEEEQSDETKDEPTEENNTTPDEPVDTPSMEMEELAPQPQQQLQQPQERQNKTNEQEHMTTGTTGITEALGVEEQPTIQHNEEITESTTTEGPPVVVEKDEDPVMPQEDTNINDDLNTAVILSDEENEGRSVPPTPVSTPVAKISSPRGENAGPEVFRSPTQVA